MTTMKLLNNKQGIGLKYYSDLTNRIPRDEMDTWKKYFEVILKYTIDTMKVIQSAFLSNKLSREIKVKI
jgi:4-hydroxyphenylpyruvate dioxygenase-like putative hemolysin